MPLGLGAAVYVSEFAGPRQKEILKVVIELLAAIPSVVWGFIGCMVLGPDERAGDRVGVRGRVAGGTFLAMAMALVLPVVAILAYLVIQASPALTAAFLLQNPMNRMTAVASVLRWSALSSWYSGRCSSRPRPACLPAFI